MTHRALVVVSVLAFLSACGDNKRLPQPKAPPSPETTSAPAPASVDPNAGKSNSASAVNISDEIRRMCGIVDNTEKAPKFDFDSADLSPQEKELLGQVARCITEGPLKGRRVQLVGRADSRGEQEYNMNLGERRGDTVLRYLQGLGVSSGQLSVTSRGELDATGHDEGGWRKDRRVDINLVK
jgi:peptidoglycan-associated lipoprotein